MTIAPDDAGASEDVLLERIWNLLDARRAHDALHLAQESLRSAPGSAQLTAAVGSALLQLGDARGARTWLERSLSLDPSIGWVHHLRACALLDSGGAPADALASAGEAVRLEPDNEWFLYTLVHARLEVGDGAGAQAASTRLRHVAPASYLGPLADAVITLDRGRVRLRRRLRIWALALVVIVTRGSALVILAVWWVVHVLRRTPHVRRADALLNEALRLAPDSPHARVLAAEVLDLRFRFAQAVDHRVTAAAIDTGLVDPDDLATAIARRLTGVIVVLTLLWLTVVAVLASLLDVTSIIGLLGMVTILACIAAAEGFTRWQTGSLPARLRRSTAGRPAPAAAATAAAGMLLLVAGAGIAAGDGGTGFHLAALMSAPVALGATVALWLRTLSARRFLSGS